MTESMGAPVPAEEHFVPAADDAGRMAARRAAEDRARDLSETTDFEWTMRWNRDAGRYVVAPAPMQVPDRPWDETHSPARRRTDWDRNPTRYVPLEDLVVTAGSLRGSQWLSSKDRPADPARFMADLQAALDLNYGRGHFWATRHGSQINVQCRYPVR